MRMMVPMLAAVLLAAGLATVVALGSGSRDVPATPEREVEVLAAETRDAVSRTPDSVRRAQPFDALEPLVRTRPTEIPDEPGGPPRPVNEGPVTRAYYENGQLHYEGAQLLDESGLWLREGPWLAWHENGQLHEEGAYAGDRETGFWRWWYENGVPMAEGHFVDGERVGAWVYWHENGNLMTQANYAAGKAHGLWTMWHENGVRRAHGAFDQGKLSGPWTTWFDDGSIDHKGTGVYEDAVLIQD